MGDVHAAMQAWFEATESAPAVADSALEYRCFGPVRAVLEAESTYLVLMRIETPADRRGQGQASELLEWLKGVCDRYDVVLLGQANVDDASGLNQAELLDWYARHDFQIDDSHQGEPLVWYPARPSRVNAMPSAT
jgi:GNAT superfamily N-acetyltransferase